MSKPTRKRLSGAVNLVYKMAPGSGPVHLIGKPNHKPTSELQDGDLRTYQIWSSQFINWCHAKGKTAIPADQHDIAAFMREISTGYLPSTAIRIFTEISRLHAQAGYHDINELTAVAAVLSDIRAHKQEEEKQTTPRDKNPSTTNSTGPLPQPLALLGQGKRRRHQRTHHGEHLRLHPRGVQIPPGQKGPSQATRNIRDVRTPPRPYQGTGSDRAA